MEMDNDHYKSSGFSQVGRTQEVHWNNTGTIPTMILSFLCLSALCQLGTRCNMCTHS